VARITLQKTGKGKKKGSAEKKKSQDPTKEEGFKNPWEERVPQRARGSETRPQAGFFFKRTKRGPYPIKNR